METAVTKDGVTVKPGQKVWVFGSCGIHETTVQEPVGLVTDYSIWNNRIPASEAYSTKAAAEKARYGKEVS